MSIPRVNEGKLSGTACKSRSPRLRNRLRGSCATRSIGGDRHILHSGWRPQRNVPRGPPRWRPEGQVAWSRLRDDEAAGGAQAPAEGAPPQGQRGLEPARWRPRAAAHARSLRAGIEPGDPTCMPLRFGEAVAGPNRPGWTFNGWTGPRRQPEGGDHDAGVRACGQVSEGRLVSSRPAQRGRRSPASRMPRKPPRWQWKPPYLQAQAYSRRPGFIFCSLLPQATENGTGRRDLPTHPQHR